MESIDLSKEISEAFPEVKFEQGKQFLTFTCTAEQSNSLLSKLKSDGYDSLSCLTAVDWVDHFDIVYTLYSARDKATVIVKVPVADREHPTTDSITNLWKGAELLECELYDLFGIRFNNHPHLRRVFLSENWDGYPLRKDYVDEINMITL